MNAIRFPLVLAVTVLLWGCAAPQSDQPMAETTAKAEKCVRVTGSNLCRKEGSGQLANVESMSGDALRKSPDALSGPTPGKVGN